MGWRPAWAKVIEILSQKQHTNKRAGDVDPVVEYPRSMCEALGSIPRTEKNKNPPPSSSHNTEMQATDSPE
jgi:hypothetical protein